MQTHKHKYGDADNLKTALIDFTFQGNGEENKDRSPKRMFKNKKFFSQSFDKNEEAKEEVNYDMDIPMESFDEKHFSRYGNGQLLNKLLLKSCRRKLFYLR